MHSLTQKMGSKLSGENKKRLKSACSTALTALDATLKIVKSNVIIAIPGLHPGLSGLIILVEVAQVSNSGILTGQSELIFVQKMIDDADGVQRLATQTLRLLAVVRQLKESNILLSPPSLSRMESLSKWVSMGSNMTILIYFSSWTVAAKDIERLANRGRIERALHYSDNYRTIADCIQDITSSVEAFIVRALTLFLLYFCSTIDENFLTTVRSLNCYWVHRTCKHASQYSGKGTILTNNNGCRTLRLQATIWKPWRLQTLVETSMPDMAHGIKLVETW